MGNKNEQPRPNTKDIVAAAEKSGFNLEFKANDIISNAGFNTELNHVLIHDNQNKEIDIIAEYKNKCHLVVECKGSGNNSILIAVKASTERYENDKKLLGNFYINPNSQTIIRLETFDIANAAEHYTITGDFFTWKSNKKLLNKASKNDDMNNFYKAQRQILDALIAYKWKLSQATNKQHRERHSLIPLIITNVPIWVVHYGKSKTDQTSEPRAQMHKWIFQRLIIDNKLPIYTYQPDYCLIKSPVSYPLAIINIDYLEEAIEQIINLLPRPYIGDKNLINLGDSMIDEI